MSSMGLPISRGMRFGDREAGGRASAARCIAPASSRERCAAVGPMTGRAIVPQNDSLPAQPGRCDGDRASSGASSILALLPSWPSAAAPFALLLWRVFNSTKARVAGAFRAQSPASERKRAAPGKGSRAPSNFSRYDLPLRCCCFPSSSTTPTHHCYFPPCNQSACVRQALACIVLRRSLDIRLHRCLVHPRSPLAWPAVFASSTAQWASFPPPPPHISWPLRRLLLVT